MPRDILMGVVTGAQGLKGEVKVKTFTETPDRLGAYGRLHTTGGREFVVKWARRAKADIAVVRFEGIGDRTQAEQLKGTELYVARAVLPPTGEEEFYHADLIGLAAQDSEGRTLGVVSGLHNFGAGDVIAIAMPDGDNLFLPFTREVVPVVDMEAGHIVVAAPAETSDERNAP